MALYTAILPISKATYASKLSDPNQTYSGTTSCTIQGSNDWIYRTFLQYDLSSIPNGATIISAKMYVYCTYWNDKGGSGTTNISRVTSEWDEATLCWNKQPSFTGTYLSANVKAPAVNTWGEWDITTLVQEWVSGIYPNYGLHIKNNNEGLYRVNWNISTDRNAGGNGTYIEVVYERDIYKYLVEDETTIYSPLSDGLVDLGTKERTSELFETYGTDETPAWDLISHLIDPKILVWTDEVIPDSVTNVIKATMKASPLPQTIISDKIDLTHSSITGIESATLNCEGNILFAVSFDNKTTWKSWNGTEWLTISEEFSGMTKELFESITYDQWLSLYTGASSFYIRASLLDITAKLTQIYIEFAN